MKKKVIFSVIGLLIISVGAYLFFNFGSAPKIIDASFQLKAQTEDLNGIDPKTKFTLTTESDFSESDVKEIIHFVPETEFDVNKKSKILGKLITTVAAQEDPSAPKPTYEYEIIPKDELNQSDIYQVQIANDENADRQYSWAFQVKAPFGVLGTHPADQATYAPTDSSIEIAFNRELTNEPGNKLKITPQVSGRTELHGSKIVFLPSGLKENTVYTVTLSKDYQVEGESLGKDIEFSFETANQGVQDYSRVYLEDEFTTFVPGKAPVLFTSWSQNYPENLNLEVYQIPTIDEFIKSYSDSRDWSLGWTSFYRQTFTDSLNLSKYKSILTFQPEILETNYRRYIEFPEALQSGYYIVALEQNDFTEVAWLQVTPITHYHTISSNLGLMWIYDFVKETPIDNVQISYTSGSQTAELSKTNALGLAEFKTPENFKLDYDDTNYHEPRIFKAEVEGYKPAAILASRNYWYFGGVDQGDQYWDYLSTDRYVYRPNDSVQFWGIVKGRNQDFSTNKVDVVIKNASYYYFDYFFGDTEYLIKSEATISKFDTVQGEFDLQGIPPGYYTVEIEHNGQFVTSTQIEVQDYTKPAYQIDVTPSAYGIKSGDTVTFDVEASFFDGTPFPDLELDYSGYIYNDDVTGSVTLDEKGKGQFTYQAPYFPDYTSSYPLSLYLTTRPKGAEESEITVSTNIQIFNVDNYLQAFTEEISDNNYKITAKVNQIIPENAESEYGYYEEYIGDPIPNRSVTAKINRIWYTKTKTGEYYDPIFKINRAQYEYNRNEEITETLTGETDSSGEWIFEKELPYVSGEYYEIQFEVRDSRGYLTTTSSYPYPDNFYSQNNEQFNLTLEQAKSGDDTKYKADENVKLKLTLSDNDSSKNVLLYKYKQDIEAFSVSTDREFEETFREGDIPSVAYQAVALGPNGFEESNIVYIEYDEQESKLDIELNPDKETYAPGEEVKVDIKVTDKNGSGVDATVNVSAVDEALFHILPYNFSKDILQDFFRTTVNQPETGSTKYAFLASEGAEQGGCFLAGTQVLLKNGKTINIEDLKVGDQIATLISDESTTLAPAVIQGVAEYSVDGYIIINDRLRLTKEHEIYLNGQWDYAGAAKPGDLLIDPTGNPIQITSIKEFEAPNTPVYNIIVGKYHTYFADGFYVHNAEKGGSPRSEFADRAVFESIETDGSGSGSVTFKAPDNITSWRLTTKAFSPRELKLGENTVTIPTTLPFFVDATTAPSYLEGDKPVIRARAFGVEYQVGVNTDFALENESLNINQTQSSTTPEVEFQLDALPIGNYELRLGAEQGSLGDALIETINVINSYKTHSSTETYKITDSLKKIKGTENGFTNLTFIDNGRGKYYSSLLNHSFFSSIRGDTTLSQYYAIKLLNQHFDKSEPLPDLDVDSLHSEREGLTLLPYGDTELEFSAKGADLAPDNVYTPQLIAYFTDVITNDLSDLSRQSKAFYGLASLNKPVLNKLKLLAEEDGLKLEDKVYVALGLAKLGDKELAREIYMNEIRPELRFEGGQAWIDKAGSEKLTATIAMLASYANVSSDADLLWQYISTHNPEDDLDDIEEVLFIRSALARTPKVEAGLNFKTKDRSSRIRLENGEIFSVDVSADELKTVEFSNIKGDALLISTFYEPGRNENQLDSRLSITRDYLLDGSPTTELQEGQEVTVRLSPKISAGSVEGSYEVIDYLPSGLKPITKTSDRYTYSACDRIWTPSKIVGNQITFYLYKSPNSDINCLNKQIQYKARVVSKGEYKAEGAQIQSLRQIDNINISDDQTITIK